MSDFPTASTEQRLLDTSLVLLVAYNAVFLADIVFEEGQPDNLATRIMQFIDLRRGWVTLFEAVADISLFIDMVVRHDQYSDRWRFARVTGVAIAGAGLVFKPFAFYLNSSYLE